MTKLEQAARQALVALEDVMAEFDGSWALADTAITALREALDHSGEANEMVVGWDRVRPEAIASDPLYQQGFVDGVEECRNHVAEQAEQEPVAWTYTRKGIYDKLTELGASITQSCCNVPDKRCGADEWVLQTVQIELLLDAITAPVRTKDPCNPLQDLTDDEIVELWRECDGMSIEDYARAIIAADREKNK